MDGFIITAAVILGVIALIELTTFFFSLPDEGNPPFVEVLPVFAGDEQFQERIEYLMCRSRGRQMLIIVDYSADSTQKELCTRLANNDPDAVFITSTELEKSFKKIFSETFAIRDEI